MIDQIVCFIESLAAGGWLFLQSWTMVEGVALLTNEAAVFAVAGSAGGAGVVDRVVVA